jgi:hypothetical protein
MTNLPMKAISILMSSHPMTTLPMEATPISMMTHPITTPSMEATYLHAMTTRPETTLPTEAISTPVTTSHHDNFLWKLFPSQGQLAPWQLSRGAIYIPMTTRFKKNSLIGAISILMTTYPMTTPPMKAASLEHMFLERFSDNSTSGMLPSWCIFPWHFALR